MNPWISESTNFIPANVRILVVGRLLYDRVRDVELPDVQAADDVPGRDSRTHDAVADLDLFMKGL
jgi:hypothetical protein